VLQISAWEHRRKSLLLGKHFPLFMPDTLPKRVWDRVVSVTILWNLWYNPALLAFSDRLHDYLP
jgi:hypothetical protein